MSLKQALAGNEHNVKDRLAEVVYMLGCRWGISRPLNLGFLVSGLQLRIRVDVASAFNFPDGAY